MPVRPVRAWPGFFPGRMPVNAGATAWSMWEWRSEWLCSRPPSASVTVRGRWGTRVEVQRPAHVSAEHVLRAPAVVQDGGDLGSGAAEYVWHLEACRTGWQAHWLCQPEVAPPFSSDLAPAGGCRGR